jgi:hypothetical protein
MKKKFVCFSIWIIFCILLPAGPSSAQPADIDWTVRRQFQTTGQPLDIAVSNDGKLMFVLTADTVAAYADNADKPFKQIPVHGNFDRIVYLESTDSLVLSSTSTHTVQILDIDFVQNISIEGSPFMGPENAPVTLVVFDDYQ